MKHLATIAAFAAFALYPFVANAQEMTSARGDLFDSPLSGLTFIETDLFAAGRGVFLQPWVVGPSVDHAEFQGLGPLYNRLSCGACHVKVGRGKAPEDGVNFKTTLVRLSIPGRGPHGEPVGEPGYGGQLNTDGIPGVKGEGQAYFNFEKQTVSLAGGEIVELQKPILRFRGLAYGELRPEALTSVRATPPLSGLGLLELVPENEILALAQENGGHPNWVWDFAHNRKALGRFGWKAAEPSIKQQSAMALLQDIGITSSVFPLEDCSDREDVCSGLGSGGKVKEASDYLLAAVTSYVTDIAPPAQRGEGADAVQRGSQKYSEFGCGQCHRNKLSIPNRQDIHPYTDLLLHDMGEGLADGRPDYEAGPRDWRTPPLWGLGLVATTGVTPSYLHDGRARSLTEAIVWHGGEAAAATQEFISAPPDARADLIQFLNSL